MAHPREPEKTATHPEPNQADLDELWLQMIAARERGDLDLAGRTARRLLPLVPETSENDEPTYPHVLGVLATIEWLAGSAQATGLIPDRLQHYESDSIVGAHLEVVHAVFLSNIGDLSGSARSLRAGTERIAAAAKRHGTRILPILSDAVRVGERTLGALGDGDDTEALEHLRSAATTAAAILLDELRTDPDFLRLDITRWAARVLDQLERYAESVEYHELHVMLNQWRFGEDSIELADAAADLGTAYDKSGDFHRAGQWYRLAYHRYEDELGTIDPQTRLMRANIAEIARVQGNPTYAEQELRALIDLEARLDIPVGERNYLVPLHLAMILVSRKELDEARHYLDMAMSVASAAAGPDSAQCGRVSLAIAQSFVQDENYRAAIAHYDEAIRKLGQHRQDWRSESDLNIERKICALHLTDSPRALVHEILDDLTHYEQNLGTSADPTLTTYRLHLASHMLDLELLEDLYDELPRIQAGAYRDLLTSIHYGTPESTRSFFSQYLELLRFDLHRLLRVGDSQKAAKAVYEKVRSVRGFETRLARWRSQWARSHGLKAQRGAIDAAQRTVTQLKLSLVGNPDDSALQSDLVRAQRSLKEAEQRYAEAFSTMAETFTSELFSAIGSLPKATAVVTYSLSPEFEDRAQHLLAFVELCEATEVQFFDLGESGPIFDLIEHFRSEIRIQSRAPFALHGWRQISRDLWRHLIEPLQHSLAGIDNLWIIPEANLTRLPYGLLINSADKLLMDEFLISYKFALDQSAAPASSAGPPVVLGNPTYDTVRRQTTRTGFDDETDETRFLSSFRDAGRFKPLPATRDECEEIAANLGVTPVLGLEATDAYLLAVQDPLCLHVATHGFYLPPDAEAIVGAPGDMLHRRGLLEEALERAGLALAGANDYLDGEPLPPGRGDGLAYASEVAAMDLTGTRLVTLSACQTGLGDVSTGDGTHGLQRAFITAGASSVVCSLWEVPDEPTRMLFVEFYRWVTSDFSASQALRLATRAVAAEYPSRPMYWAGFVLYGDDADLKVSGPPPTVEEAFEPATETVADPDLESPVGQAEKRLSHAARESDAGHLDAATRLYDTVVDDERLPDSFRRRARIDRARHLRTHGDYDAARADYSAIAMDEEASTKIRTEAKFGVALTYMQQGSYDEATARYTDYLSATNLDEEERARALVNRGYCYFAGADIDAAFEDFDMVVNTKHVPADQRAKALLGRSRCHKALDDYRRAFADADAVMHLVDVPPDVLAGAYLERGIIKGLTGRADWREDLELGLSVDGASEARRAELLELLQLNQ